jgi:small multidrug resistance family-3 protein
LEVFAKSVAAILSGDVMKEVSPFFEGLAGFFVLGLYGVVVTFQPLPFGRAYAAYGGFFVVLSILWAMLLDGFHPDQ